MPVNTSMRASCRLWRRPRAVRSCSRSTSVVCPLGARLLHPVGRLPEEQTGREGGSEVGHVDRPVVVAQGQLLCAQPPENVGPVDASGEQHPDARQQAETENLEDQGDPLEGPGRQQQDDGHPGQSAPWGSEAGVQQVHALPDGHQISGDVEGVGDQKGAQQHQNHGPAGPRILASSQSTQVQARRERRAVADLLHRHHQGEAEDGGPQRPRAQQRPCLRVGRAGAY